MDAILRLRGGAVGASPNWRDSVSPELRNQLVHKLILALSPPAAPTTMSELEAFATETEGNSFLEAHTRSEYYHLLAEKLFKKQKEKNLQQQQQQQYL